MTSSTDGKKADAYRCRLKLSLESDAGDDVIVDLELQECLRGPFDGKELLRLPNRIANLLEGSLLPKFQRELWDWADGQVPAETSNFDDEFARRCDRNDEVIEGLEWLSPHVESDEEHEWKSRMVDILIARQENESVR